MEMDDTAVKYGYSYDKKATYLTENNNIEPRDLYLINKHMLSTIYFSVANIYSPGMRIRFVVTVFVTAVFLCGLSFGVFSSFPRGALSFLLTYFGLGSGTSHSVHSGRVKLGLFTDTLQFKFKDGLKQQPPCFTNDHQNDNINLEQKVNIDSNTNCEHVSSSPHTYYDTSVSVRYKQRFTASKDVKREAVAAMNIALDLQNRGKTDKAMKVFQHALALDPSHADILTAFGEFLEWHVKDIVKADHMYHIALENSPEHGRALQNRKRTGPIVEEIDQARFNRVDKKRTLLYTIPPHHPGLRRAKREAYFAHIYHTNAIEGNTLTLAQTRSIVETRVAVGGKSLREQNEVLGLDAALSYINSTLVGHVGRLTLQDILDIHIRVLGYVDPIDAGRFRTTQVYVGDFIPPAARDLQDHMTQLIEWLNSEEALALHPIEFAALAHYRLVAIHPFFDGNGRTSRLLMNLILMEAGFPPVSIEVNDRLTYYETLQQANDGDIRPFIRFIADCAERTLDEYLSVTMENAEVVLPSVHRNKFMPQERVIYVDKDEKDDDEEKQSSNGNVINSAQDENS
ncbi:protein adenylyltransferase FICD-like [Physella acuta]|uniref:protein adenylyltransferase FICD-like n=1 Tax=Physella acuta TaxID=109671 RepID=UPI0027DB9D28|nr:protein adenylyltransferase FICD-like [Physella acuta]